MHSPLEGRLGSLQAELERLKLDGWLLYDFHGANPVASSLLGLEPQTRRYFVLIPTRGEPCALSHRIEQQAWRAWPWRNRVYLSWRELDDGLECLLKGARRVAMEVSLCGDIPYLDRTPFGVAERVRSLGVDICSSAELVTRFHSCWSDFGRESHARCSAVVREAVFAAFRRVSAALGRGGRLTEWELRRWLKDELARRGLSRDPDAIVAIGPNAADPHYAPTAENHSPISPGDTLLIDCWGGESAPGAVPADQTWMAFAGNVLPARLASVWEGVRAAREAALAFLRTRRDQGTAGYQVDEVAREEIRSRGFGDRFLHRLGHSIDTDLHGSGPNLDNLETRDTRLLTPGLGFSLEPGIYLPGELGVRSEVNVFLAADGPVVTTPGPQDRPELLLS